MRRFAKGDGSPVASPPKAEVESGATMTAKPFARLRRGEIPLPHIILCYIKSIAARGRPRRFPKGDRKALWSRPQARNLCLWQSNRFKRKQYQTYATPAKNRSQHSCWERFFCTPGHAEPRSPHGERAKGLLLQLTGAVGAAGGLQRNFTQAVGALLGGGGRGFLLLADGQQLVDGANQAE